MIDEQDHEDVIKALALKQHFEDRLSLARQYMERTELAIIKAKNSYTEYQKAKSMLETVCNLYEKLK